MNTQKNGSKKEAKRFEELFNSVSEGEQRQHEARMIMYRFLSIVEEEMEQKGWNKKELAERIGTSASYITQLFRGHKLVNLLTLAKIQNALGIQFRIDKASDEEGFWFFKPNKGSGSKDEFPEDLPDTAEGLVA